MLETESGVDSGDNTGVLEDVVEFDLERSGVEERLESFVRRSFLTDGSLVNNLLDSLGSVFCIELLGDILYVITDGRVGNCVRVGLEGSDKGDIESGLSKLSLSGNSKGEGVLKTTCWVTAVAEDILI